MVELIDPDLDYEDGAPEGDEVSGRDVQLMNLQAGQLVGELVRTTLGPKGMDKLLIDSDGMGIVTNNGATILKENVDHPVADVVRDISNTQETEVGDGTTTTAIVGSQLLDEATWLIEQDLHATTVVRGYREAARVAADRLEELAIDVDVEDTDVLTDVAATSMAGKGTEGDDRRLAELVVEAASEVSEEGSFDFEHVDVQKIEGGWVGQSHLLDSVILEKDRADPGMPYLVQEPGIALVYGSIDLNDVAADIDIELGGVGDLEHLLDREHAAVQRYVELLEDAGADVLVCEHQIDDPITAAMADAGIYAVQMAGMDRPELLAEATGANVVSDVRELEAEDVGHAERVIEETIDGDLRTSVEGGAAGGAVTLVLRGTTDNLLDELNRAVQDALDTVSSVLDEGRVLPGGGAVETELSMALREHAPTAGDRRQFAIEAFADALEMIPRTLGENAGIDPIDGVLDLRTEHDAGNATAGIDAYSGEIRDMAEAGVYEPFPVKRGAIKRATEAAITVLRIDGIIPAELPDEQAEEIDETQRQAMDGTLAEDIMEADDEEDKEDLPGRYPV